MANQLATIGDETLLNLVTNGDISKLKPDQQLQYIKARCEAAGLDPRTVPFQIIPVQGRRVLYATKEATNQLAAINCVITQILDQQTIDGVHVVTVRAQCKDGRQTDEIGAVNVEGLRGDARCNALMKAVTKAKRRAILSVCGLGMLDESELETVPTAPDRPAIQEPKRKSEADAPAKPSDSIAMVEEMFNATPAKEQPSAAPAPASGPKMTKAQQGKLMAMAKEVGIKNQIETWRGFLSLAFPEKKWTKDTPSSGDLTREEASIVIERLKFVQDGLAEIDAAGRYTEAEVPA